MPIHFDMDRMNATFETHTKWWKGELDRPLISITLTDAYPIEQKAPAPFLSQENCTQLHWTPEQIIDAMDEELSKYEFLGDAYPNINFDVFGPGILAAMCGAKLDNSSGRVWFYMDPKLPIEDIHVHYDPENVWSKRIKDIYRAGMERWNGLVIMSMPDLGGILDVASSLLGCEELMYAFYDEPEEVHRLIGEIENAWYDAYWDLAAVLKPQRGFTDWAKVLSREPSFIPQCDFCYMIGNPMFRSFVLDTLRKDTEILTNTMYHLDGAGQLPHLDDILALEKLNAIQWVPGAGSPESKHWIPVFQKITQAGKQFQIVGGPEDFLHIVKTLHGSPYYYQYMSVSERSIADEMLQAR